MREEISRLAARLGLGESAATAVELTVMALLLALGAIAAFLIAKRLVLRLATAAAERTETDWDDRLVQHRVFLWIAHLVPGVVLYLFAPTALEGAAGLVAGIRLASQVYMVLVGVLTVDALLNAALEIYNGFEVSRQVPLKSFVQVAKILLYVAALILVVATLIGKSPVFLLGSMGVLASVLMLVFKDPILGLVAGIQLSTNKMLSKGDWIEMSDYGADGDVIDIALTTVKVQNWDKTITTVPTYALISDSFKNWRGMSESGGRRIKRAVYIDMSSIRHCTPEMIERFSRIFLLRDHLDAKLEELAAWNAEHGLDESDRVSSRRLTNIGIFRAYLLAYLRSHPGIHQELTLLVRQLAPTPDGLPLEIYCFSADQRWPEYESLQADIFDHILAVAPEFDLRIFQYPSGSDLQRLSPERRPPAEAGRAGGSQPPAEPA